MQTAEHMYKCTDAVITVPNIVYATSHNENAIGRSILLGSKNVRKEGALFIFYFKRT